MEKLIIAPSVLSADFSKLGSEIAMLNESEAQWIHIDIMDGMFVPNISFGFPVLEAINKKSEKFLDVHLMIEKPDRYLTQFLLSYFFQYIQLYMENFQELILHREKQLL
jgi:ribulose-phosphate 3-epimerase